MPIHNWTKVDAGIFHDFHHAWIAELRNILNGGLLPLGYYYALTTTGSVALLEKPPKVRVIQKSDADLYAKKANRIAIRHSSDDRIIAMIEIVSPGNKSSRHAIDELLDKAWSVIDQGIHLLLIDLFPPTARDPQGIHALIWGDAAPAPPDGQPLTLAAYQAGAARTAFVEPTAIGCALVDMPLFLDDEHYVPVPLEATYQAAWRGVALRWKAVLQAPPAT